MRAELTRKPMMPPRALSLSVLVLMAASPSCVRLKEGSDRATPTVVEPRGPQQGSEDAAVDARSDAGDTTGDANHAAGASGAGAGGSQAIPDSGVICGDGLVSGDETCDTGIAGGKPGACPIECVATRDCAAQKLQGVGCHAECVPLPLECMNGDGCCAQGCNHLTDTDCSAMCGDGEVQEAERETCEPGYDPCPTQEECEAEDDDPCTIDQLVGEEENCNAACIHETTTALTSGDQCCLPDSNANTDGDCEPRCGNGVIEADESCDGGDGCSENCTLLRTPEQEACIARVSRGGDDLCAACTCIACPAVMKACRYSGNSTRDARCSEVAVCANEERCAGDACYCGDYPDRVGCALFANGPCKAEVERAADSTDAARIQAEHANPDTALGRAMVLIECTVANCSSACP